MCKRNGKFVDYLLLHCEVACAMWIIIIIFFTADNSECCCVEDGTFVPCDVFGRK
jgi:hypothetical protein